MKKHLILFLVVISVLLVLAEVMFGQEKTIDLAAEYDLSLRETSGDVSYYKMRTVYYHGNSMGITHSIDELITSFKREAVKIEKSTHLVKFTWKAAKIGHQTKLQEKISNWKILPYADGFAYQLDFKHFDFPGQIDFSPIPGTLQGMKFMVNILDAHAQFDLLRTESAGGISQIKKTGDKISNPGAGESTAWDFNTFIQDSDFTNGAYETMFTGICMVDGKKCAVLEYINTESRIKNKAQVTPKMTIEQEGTSNFWGRIFIDLETGSLIKGDLFEYVVMHATMPGQSQPMRLFERRLVEIWNISEEKYNEEL
ncbi:MAG: hypothetical protein JSV17_01015 [Candidatus Aminicenantes bacterium]|nr:MAG: hypothetical protein JSV17_01015 [Candidatus Aminicenantes bacterium]